MSFFNLFSKSKISDQLKNSSQKLSQAITMFKEVNGDKEQFLSIAMERLQITKGNAGIYFAKAKERV